MRSSMRHELIVLPKGAHARIAKAIRTGGVDIELWEDKSVQRHRHPGDSLYLCRHGEAAVELLVPRLARQLAARRWLWGRRDA